MYAADATLIEVAESGDYDAGYCLELCIRLRKEAPGCKLLLLCPEQNEQSVATDLVARCAEQIGDFLFYDASAGYLLSKLRNASKS